MVKWVFTVLVSSIALYVTFSNISRRSGSCKRPLTIVREHRPWHFSHHRCVDHSLLSSAGQTRRCSCCFPVRYDVLLMRCQGGVPIWPPFGAQHDELFCVCSTHWQSCTCGARYKKSTGDSLISSDTYSLYEHVVPTARSDRTPGGRCVRVRTRCAGGLTSRVPFNLSYFDIKSLSKM